MKTRSIKQKLIFLSASLLLLLVATGVVAFFGNKELGKNLDNISNVQLPAISNMRLADMMHDGLRAVVYRALYITDRASTEDKKEVAQELDEMSKAILSYVEEIDKLDVNPDTKEAINKAKPDIASYVKASEEIVALAILGHADAASAKMKDFQAAFSALEEKLGALGDLIEKDADAHRKEAELTAARLSTINIALMIAGVLGGILISFLIIKDLMSVLENVISRLTNSSRELTLSSSQSAASATELSEASTQQAASLQQTMASAEEISAMVNQNAESANKVKDAVHTNQQASEDGTTSVSEMLSAIGEIKVTNDEILSQMQNSNTEFGAIVKIITEIGEKTKVINDIVFQTKLLSFNASVEAARAGEHGKGFAVVAEEVGNLAQMSGNAAKEITDMLSASIKNVNDIVATTTQRVDRLVEVGKDKISMGQATATKCREALDKISRNASLVSSMVAEITGASKEQAQGIQEINKAIGQLDQVTQQNASVAQQSSSQAESLNTEAIALSEAVKQLADFAGIRATGASKGKVIPMPAAKAATKNKSPRLVASKKVAGDQHAPSATDPNFEEF